jgi:hypothetical protein
MNDFNAASVAVTHDMMTTNSPDREALTHIARTPSPLDAQNPSERRMFPVLMFTDTQNDTEGDGSSISSSNVAVGE